MTADDDLIARRAASFGTTAEPYHRYRPGYPRTAVDWLLEPLAGDRPPRVLDLGAGTGKLTATLIEAGAQVSAVEPDEAMLGVLRRELPGVRALAGGAEDIPLPDASVDAVLVGQALHWFDTARAYPQIARVLRPGGVLGALWNTEDDRVDWVADLIQTTRAGTSLLRLRDRYVVADTERFGATERAEFAWGRPMDIDELIATVGTHSHLLVCEEAERAAVLDRARGYLRGRAETGTGGFDLPMVTIAIRAALAQPSAGTPS